MPATVFVPGLVAEIEVGAAAVAPWRLVAGAGFFDAMEPAEVEVATAGPGDADGAECATAALVVDAHGSTVCPAGCAAAFLWWKRDVMLETVVAAVAAVDEA